MAEKIELSFHGGDADRHVLDLYDAGRALYGAARFIYTLENFRITGRIVEHATSARVKFEVTAARPGSLTFDISQVVAAVGPEAAKELFVKVPLSVLTAWVRQRLRGDKKEEKKEVDPAVEQAVEIEKERTSQAAIEGMRDVALAMKDLAEKAIEAQNTANARQSALLREHEAELAKIPAAKAKQLASKVRPALIDMARPTTSTAAYMSLSIGDGAKPVLYMDERSVEGLKGNQLDDLPELSEVKFIQYNVENGWGKVRLPSRKRPFSFVVHPILRPLSSGQILAAMHDGKQVWVWFYYLRDKAQNPVHLVFAKFADEKEVPT